MPALVLALGAPVVVAQDYGTEKPREIPVISIPLTPEQKTALHAVDVRLAGVEALVARIDDPAYKATVVTALKDLQKRRGDMGKNFDAGLYESLMHSVISRYQTVALWLTPARVSGAGAKSEAAPKPVPPVDKKSGTKAASQ